MKEQGNEGNHKKQKGTSEGWQGSRTEVSRGDFWRRGESEERVAELAPKSSSFFSINSNSFFSLQPEDLLRGAEGVL